MYLREIKPTFMDNIAQIIGLVSALLTTTAFLPQVIKTWRTRSTSDLSPLMFSLFFVGIAGWLVYGLLIQDIPIIIANVVTICLAGAILYFIIIGEKSYSVSHIGLYVSDLEYMKDFYCRVFGAKADKKYVNREKGFSSYFLRFPVGASLELMHLTGNKRQDNFSVIGHIALSVGSRTAVDELAGLLLAEGLEVVNKPRTTGDGFYESLVKDPEGNFIEITL